MKLDQLKPFDAVVAVVVAVVAMAAGAGHREIVAERLSRAGALSRAPRLPLEPSAAAPFRPIRVIVSAAGGAQVRDAPNEGGGVLAQLRAGAIVAQLGAADARGWARARLDADREGWMRREDLAPPATSAEVVALFDAYEGFRPVRAITAARSGALYTSSGLTQRFSEFSAGEKLQLLATAGQATLVSMWDGGSSRVIGYARTAELERKIARVAPPKPKPKPEPKPEPERATMPASAAETTPAPGPVQVPQASPAPPDSSAAATADLPGTDRAGLGEAAAALEEAQDEYAGGNFAQAEAKAERALALGRSDAVVVVAMAACKQGKLTKAQRYAKRLQGAKLAQLTAACPGVHESTRPTGATELDAPGAGAP